MFGRMQKNERIQSISMVEKMFDSNSIKTTVFFDQAAMHWAEQPCALLNHFKATKTFGKYSTA